MSAPRRPGRLRVSGDLAVVLLLFAGLVAFSAYTTARRPDRSAPPALGASTHSTQPGGTAALYLWLEELGYRVERIEGSLFELDDEARLVFILAPVVDFNDLEDVVVRRWMRGANRTLVVATHGWLGGDLLHALGASVEQDVAAAEALTPTLPLLNSPPPGPIAARAGDGVRLGRDNYVAHLVAGDVPVLVSFREGPGRVILTTAVTPFTNEGLRDPGSARLVYNLLAGLEPGALIQFDEVHHGVRWESRDTFVAWLGRSPWGWAGLYAAVVTLGWTLLRGRPFGRPRPLPERTARRAQGEYVVAMARLFRRAGRRAFVLRHQHDRLKRELARPWRLNPDLPDDDLVRELARLRDDLSEERAAELRALLACLAAGRAGEAELVRLAAQVEAWMRGKHAH